MNIAYKIIMIIVGCFVAYYIMSLATNSKKLINGMALQSTDGKSITKVSDNIKNLEQEFKIFSENTKRELQNIKSDGKEQEAEIKEALEEIRRAESNQEAKFKESLAEISVNEATQEANFKAAIEKISTIKNNSVNNDDIYLNINDFNAEKKVDDAREETIEKRLAEQGKIIQELLEANAGIRKELDSKTAEIEVLKSKIQNTSDLVAAFKDMGDEDFAVHFQEVMTQMSGAGGQAYAGLQKQLDNLNEAIKDSKALTAKTLQGIEKSMESLENKTVQAISDTKQGVDRELKELLTKNNNGAVPNQDIAVQDMVNKVNVELEVIKRELERVQKKIEQVVSADNNSTPQEPIGIVVNTVFDKSLVMINTAEGTFIFNPYADFTGVVRVRDSEGNERMVLVPYTGDYLKIGKNIIDTGPFARSCAQGINCNIDVRGSMNSPVVK